MSPSTHADLVVIALNLWPAHDPLATALHASVANVEAVMIDGQWRKRDDALVGVDVETVKAALLESGVRLLSQMGAPAS